MVEGEGPALLDLAHATIESWVKSSCGTRHA